MDISNTDRALKPALDTPLACFGILAVTLVIGTMALAHLPVIPLLVLWFGLGVMAAMPLAANASVRRAHWLRTKSAANPLYGLRRSGVVRLLFWSVIGVAGVGILLVRLSAGGIVEWLGVMAGAATALAMMLWGRRLASRLEARVHDTAALRRWAIALGAFATFSVSLSIGVLTGPSVAVPEQAATTMLVTEAYGAHRLVEGVISWALGQVAGLGLLPLWLEGLLAFLVLGMSGFSVASLTVAALMPSGEWSRAVATASDLPDAPPPHRPAIWALALVAGLGVAGLSQTETWLSTQMPQDRPIAHAQIVMERIGVTLHPVGTHERIMADREAFVARDMAALAEMQELTDTAFDAMADQVDTFLDEYYSLQAEYARLGISILGMVRGDAEAAVEEYLNRRLAAALDNDAYFRAIDEKLDALELVEARVALIAEESARLNDRSSDALNPARIRIVAEFPALAPPPELQSTGFSSVVEARFGGSVVIGTMSAVIARRVVARLAQRGIVRIGARAFLAVVPLVGTAIFFGSDYAMLKLEEHFNRDVFRAEILEALENQRDLIVQSLEGVASGDSPQGKVMTP